MLRKGPYAVVIILIIIIANLYIAATKTAAKDLDCKPLDPRQEVSKEIEADIQGSAKTLLKIGQAAGNLDVKYKNTVKALQDKYPTSD